MTREDILKEIIEGYRRTIKQRYQYENIKRNYAIPKSITENTVNQLRNYFLEFIYPEYDTRVELDKAFKSLDDYIKHPQKLIRILLDASILVFNYGRHLPKILKSGLKAMKSFRAAAKFENTFVDKAIENNIKGPFDQSKINTLLKSLPQEDIEDFIDVSQSLFNTLHNQALVNKITEIMEYLIGIMNQKSNIYSESQLRGLEIALELLVEGNKLFNQLEAEDQKKLVYLITEIERDVLDQISQ